MPKRDEHIAEGGFTLAGIDRVRQRALKSCIGCEDFPVPQWQLVKLHGRGDLPKLELTGIRLRSFSSEGFFSEAGTKLEVLAELLERGRPALPQASLGVHCRLSYNRRRSIVEEVGINIWDEDPEFTCWLHALLGHCDLLAGEAVLNRIIRAARLPAQVERAAQYGIEHVEVKRTGNRKAYGGYPYLYGAMFILSAVPRASPETLLKRVRAALLELNVTPREYSWRAHDYGDGALCAYDKLRGLRLPTERHRLTLDFYVTEFGGLEELKSLVELQQHKQFLSTLCRFPLPVNKTTNRSRWAKVLVRTSRDGHGLSLVLPAPHAALLPELGKELGLRFSP